MSLIPLIRFAGVAQLAILVASALTPVQLDWRNVLAALPRLYRQMFWTYGGYVVLAIIFNGLGCLVAAPELAAGSPLARLVCLYLAVFWGVRLALQAVFDVKPYLKYWWLKAGYQLLTVLFACFTCFFAYLASR